MKKKLYVAKQTNSAYKFRRVTKHLRNEKAVQYCYFKQQVYSRQQHNHCALFLFSLCTILIISNEKAKDFLAKGPGCCCLCDLKSCSLGPTS